jgi:hypothetical protein
MRCTCSCKRLKDSKQSDDDDAKRARVRALGTRFLLSGLRLDYRRVDRRRLCALLVSTAFRVIKEDI